MRRPLRERIRQPEPTATTNTCIASAVNGQLEPTCLDQVDFTGTPTSVKQLLPASPKLASYDAAAISYYFGRWTGSFIEMRGLSQNDAAYNDYGDPFYFGHSTDPLVTIQCQATWAPCYGHPYQLHIPAKARATGGSDHHLTVIEPGGMEYDWWEFPVYPGAQDIVNGQTLKPQSDGVGSMLTGTGFLSKGGATAAGNLQLAGATLDSELMTGPLSNPTALTGATIPHALMTGYACGGSHWGGNGPIFPSTRANPPTDNPCQDGKGIPEGSRLWLDLTDTQIDALNIEPLAKPILKAAHDYGVFIIDSGGCSQPCASGAGTGIQVGGGGETQQYFSYGNPNPLYSYGSAHGWAHYNGQNVDRYVYDLLNGTVDWTQHLHVLDPCVTLKTC
ncbi:MAG: hypothetical protein GIW94_03055 [Candidatus Eremiobacteraeota bacterium]|nr:hypothetical protein [Candidatus Eremiobacteraeota bacterium]MBC5820944.1 hypothetical protein [Candidatus Eremiobacteraeota bacterium]